LTDAQRDLDPDSKFTLAYGAAHRLALAALRREGYRSEDRISVFQTLVHTLGTSAADVQVLLKAHNERNLTEYQGRIDIDEKLLADLIRCTKALEAAVAKLATTCFRAPSPCRMRGRSNTAVTLSLAVRIAIL
jgi:predicted Kef-type K+ transport protein